LQWSRLAAVPEAQLHNHGELLANIWRPPCVTSQSAAADLAGLRGRSSPGTGRGRGMGGGLILGVSGGTIAGVSRALRELLIRHVDAGTIPGGVALLGAGTAEVVTAGVASVGGGPMGEDAIMRIQSMTKAITSVAALRLVEAGRLELDQNLVDWLPELGDRQVLRSPTAELGDTVAARRAVTLRHLLTNTSGYGMVMQASPLQQAMVANGTEAGPEPPAMSADEWLGRLSELPLAFQPGEGWRYHHSFAVLGILISRLTGRPLGQHLAEDVFGPLGMTDTALWVPEGKLDRLPAAYRHGEEGLAEIEPAAGGFYAGPPSFDVSHGELVSTARDYHRFARMLAEGGRVGGQPMISPDHLQQMTSDQVPAACKTADSFFPGFWDGMGWGFGVAVKTAGPQRGRIGWSGGLGTDFFVDPDGAVGILLTQVELGKDMWSLIAEFQSLHEPS
jgi:CubicO group peptidase (beta-lactamase class C family)